MADDEQILDEVRTICESITTSLDNLFTGDDITKEQARAWATISHAAGFLETAFLEMHLRIKHLGKQTST